MAKINRGVYLFLLVVLATCVSAVAPIIDNYLPTSTTPSETEPYDTIFFLNWTDGDSPSWNVSWWVNDTIEETHWVFKTEDYFTFDGEDYPDGIYNISAQIYDGSKNEPFNTSWLLNQSNGALVEMVENVNYTLDGDIMQVNWTLKNASVSDSSTPFLYLNGTEVRGGYWDLVWQKNIPAPNGSYSLYATDVYVEKNGTILITNFNEGDVLWYDQDLNYLEMREFGYDKQPHAYNTPPIKFWSYGNNCTINNSMISLQSLAKWYLPKAGALDPFYAVPLYQMTFNITKGTSSDCDDALSCDNDTAWTLAISTNWTSRTHLAMYSYIPDAVEPELNASSRLSGLYGGSFSQGNINFFGSNWQHKRHPSVIVWGVNQGTPEYTICKFTFTNVVYCFNESAWNYSVGSPRDMTMRDDDIFMVYNVESGGTNYAYTGYYDYYGWEFSDNLRNTALLQNLGTDIEVWGMYYTNGYLYIVASNPDNSNNTIYKYKWSYDLSNLEYLDGTSVSAQANDNITLEILGDEANTKGDVEVLSFLYSPSAGNTAPSITSHSPESLSFSIAEPNNQEFLINWTDSENATVIVTWYQDGVLKNTNTTSLQDVSWTFDGNYTSAGTYNITAIVSDGEFTDFVNWTMTVTDTPAVLTEDSYTVTVTQVGNTRTTVYTGYLTVSVTDFIIPVNYTVAKSRLTDFDTRNTINFTISSSNIISLIENSTHTNFEIQPTLTTGSKTFTMSYTNTVFGSGGSDLATISGGTTSQKLTLAVEKLPDEIVSTDVYNIDIEVKLEGEYVDSDVFHVYIFDSEGELKKVITDIEREMKGKYVATVSMKNLEPGEYNFVVKANKGGNSAEHSEKFTVIESVTFERLTDTAMKNKIILASVIGLAVILVFLLISSLTYNRT